MFNIILKNLIDIFLEELALQIDYGITKTQKNFITWPFQNKLPLPQQKKQNGHNSCTLWSISGHQSTYKGKNLIDFVIKDDELPHSNVFTFESPIPLDHKAIAIITNVTINKKQPPGRKTIFDKSKHCKSLYLQDLKQIDWVVLYTAADAEDMYRIFKKVSTELIRYHAPLKTVFIWTEKKSKIKLESNDFAKSIFKKADSKKTKWNIINDTRNSIKFTQNTFYLKTVLMMLLLITTKWPNCSIRNFLN